MCVPLCLWCLEGNSAKGLQSGALTPASSIQALERCLCSRAGSRGPRTPAPAPGPVPLCLPCCACCRACPVPARTAITLHPQVSGNHKCRLGS